MRSLMLFVSVLFLSATLTLAGEKKDDAAPKVRPATVLYSVKADAGDDATAALNAVLKKHAFQSVRKLVKGKVEQVKAGEAKLPAVEVLCQEIMATGAVAFAEPDYLIAPVDTVPNDPGYASQWHHVTINSPAAWDSTTGSSSVTVAVLDTGVQADHPDLAANLLPGFNTADDPISNNIAPVHPHGTMTSGCVGAVGNNTVGVSGVAWTIKILPVRISNLSTGSAYISDMAEGIRLAADQGAKVVNLSYGGADSATIDSAAQYLRGKGGLLFMAAGNDGKNQRRYPDFASFLAVGATNSSDTGAYFSTYGNFVDLVAPGQDIYTTTTGSDYATVNGTSFASPIAAGVAALIYSVNPDFTPDQVEGFILSTCKDLGETGDDVVYGHGRIDSGAAVAAAAAPPPPPPDNLAPVANIYASPSSGTAPLVTLLDGTYSSDPDGTIVSYAWDFGDGSPVVTGTEATAVHTFSDVGNYTVQLTVTDDDGATGQATVLVKVGRTGGKPPKPPKNR